MRNESVKVSTQELWAKLFRAPNIDSYFAENGSAMITPCFSQYITDLCQQKGKTPEQVIKRSNIEKSFGHRLFSGARNPSRDTVLQLAFGFCLSTDETQQLLKTARMFMLHPKVKRDAIIAYCLRNGSTLDETNLILFDNDIPLIGGSKNE